MDGGNDGGNSSNKLRPDFSTFNGLWERKPWTVIESLPKMGPHSAPAVAILGLSYIAGKIIEAGSDLTGLTLFGALVVALLIAAIAITIFLVEKLNNAKTNKKPLDEPTEPTDDRQRSQAAGKTPG
jgi:hypothetical protein